MKSAFDLARDKLADEYGASYLMPDYMMRDFIRYFLHEAAGEPVRAAVLNARSGDGQPLLREDMKWCAPPASAGLIGAAVIDALKRQCAEREHRTAQVAAARSTNE